MASFLFLLTFLVLNTLQAQTNTHYTFIQRNDYAILYKKDNDTFVIMDTIYSKSMVIDGFRCGLIGDNFYTLEMNSPGRTGPGVRMEIKHYKIVEEKIVCETEYEYKGNLYGFGISFRGNELILQKWDTELLMMRERHIQINGENLSNITTLINACISDLRNQ